jgi:hypothetical protein
VCVCLLVAAPVRAPEVQLVVPNPSAQVAHLTLKVCGNVFRKRVLGHASFPLSSAMTAGPIRRELGITLASFNGTTVGRLSIKLRIQEIGVLVEDWVELGQGLPSMANLPPFRSGLTAATSGFTQRRLSVGSDHSSDGRKSPPSPRVRVQHLPRFRRSSSPKEQRAAVAVENPLMLGLATPELPDSKRVTFTENPMQKAAAAAMAIGSLV